MGSEEKAEVSGAAPAPARLVSLDVLRGFDMFWIIGADSFVRALERIDKGGVPGFLATQFRHVRFDGFHFYDLIFPLFVFILGVSVVYSLDKILAQHGKLGAYKRIFRRTILLFLLGVFYDEGVANIHHENVLCGVLQRLALCYFFTSLLYCHVKRKGLIALFVVILIGYWILFCFVPVPGEGKVVIERGASWAKYVDEIIPPYYDDDPEGFLSTIPAVASCLLGVFAAFLLKDSRVSPHRKVAWFIGVGLLMTVAGYLWGMQFPIAKRVWTSSYVLVAGGYSSMLMGLFYLVVDVWKLQKWAQPFIWIGMNPLTIYMAMNVVDFHGLAERLVGGDIAGACGRYGQLLVTIVALGLAMAVVRFMYKKRVFLRL